MILKQYFSDFLHKSICCWYSFELSQLVAIQMSINNICFYKEVDKNLKTTELLDCALIGVCAVIRSFTECVFDILLS